MKGCISCKYRLEQLTDGEPCTGCFNGSLWEPAPDTKDHINPDHYKSETSLECIESMEIIFGSDAVFDFCLCNAWKYIWRWKNKNGDEDLRKADWYIQRAWRYCKPDDAQKVSLIHRMKNYINCNVVKEES